MIKINLAVLMAEREIKISDLAKQTGISRTTLTALYYNQSKGIQWETLDTLCNYLRVKPNELIVQEQFSYELEILNNNNELDIDMCFNIELHCKLTHENTTTQSVLRLECQDADHSDEVNPDTGVKNLSYISFYASYSDEIRSILENVPQLVRREFENSIKDEVAFFCSPVATVDVKNINLYIT